MKPNDVIGLGNTLMDFLVEVDENKLLEFDLNKGEMQLVEEEKAKIILQKLKEHELKVELVPGGSAANTLRAIGLLGGNVILVGKVGNDEHGEMYVEQMEDHGVIPRVNGNPKTTGHAITFITPDAERTFSVHLGAALELFKEDVLEEDIKVSKVLHLEGYQLEGQTRDVVLHAVEFAKKHGTKVSLDLSDGGVIRRNKEFFKEFLKSSVDIVFANELEAHDFCGLAEEGAARDLGRSCEIAIVKVGDEGSFIAFEGEVERVSAYPAQTIDTTGAGDTYSAGFLYGFCNNWDLRKCGQLGSMLASKIVEKKGVKFDKNEMLNILSSVV